MNAAAAGSGAASPADAPVVVVADLEKRYGATRALAGVSLAVGRGEVFGLLGQNGAGKTTLVKVLLGMLAPSAGTASLLGRPVGSPPARRLVGYLPEDHRLPEYHTAPSLLDFYGALQGLPKRERRGRAAELLDLLGLAGRDRLPIRGYSKGMRQRLALAQALLHRPRVLFLDEPTDGVDPVGRKQIRELLLAERDRGVTIFINSHLLGEVEQLCDRVAILRRGAVVRAGRVAELSGDKPSWLVAFDREPPADWQPVGARLLPAAEGRLRLELEPADPAGLDGFLAAAAAAGLGLRHLERERDTLEELYLRLAAPGETTP